MVTGRSRSAMSSTITRRWLRSLAAMASRSWRTRWRRDGSDNSLRSLDGAQRNPGIAPQLTTAPDCAALHPGYRLHLFQQLHRIHRLLFQLLEAALPRGLVGAPAQDRGAMAKALAAEMVVADLDHEFRL